MFEIYLEDSYGLANEATNATNDKTAKRYFRASIFYAISAMESFVNFTGETLAKGDAFENFECAFLTDHKFGIVGDKFKMLSQLEYNRLEDKLRFLIKKYKTDFDFDTNVNWSRFIEFKKFRDSLVHPHTAEEDSSVAEYHARLKSGLAATISLIDTICSGLWGKPLRKRIREMILD